MASPIAASVSATRSCRRLSLSAVDPAGGVLAHTGPRPPGNRTHLLRRSDPREPGHWSTEPGQPGLQPPHARPLPYPRYHRGRRTFPVRRPLSDFVVPPGQSFPRCMSTAQEVPHQAVPQGRGKRFEPKRPSTTRVTLVSAEAPRTLPNCARSALRPTDVCSTSNADGFPANDLDDNAAMLRALRFNVQVHDVERDAHPLRKIERREGTKRLLAVRAKNPQELDKRAGDRRPLPWSCRVPRGRHWYQHQAGRSKDDCRLRRFAIAIGKKKVRRGSHPAV